MNAHRNANIEGNTESGSFGFLQSICYVMDLGYQ